MRKIIVCPHQKIGIRSCREGPWLTTSSPICGAVACSARSPAHERGAAPALSDNCGFPALVHRTFSTKKYRQQGIFTLQSTLNSVVIGQVVGHTTCVVGCRSCATAPHQCECALFNALHTLCMPSMTRPALSRMRDRQGKHWQSTDNARLCCAPWVWPRRVRTSDRYPARQSVPMHSLHRKPWLNRTRRRTSLPAAPPTIRKWYWARMDTIRSSSGTGLAALCLLLSAQARRPCGPNKKQCHPQVAWSQTSMAGVSGITGNDGRYPALFAGLASTSSLSWLSSTSQIQLVDGWTLLP